jgi:opacity protein-like surface antigen
LKHKTAWLLGGVCAALAFASQASAEQPNGWYVGGDVGYHWPDGIDATSKGLAPDGSPYKFKFDSEDDGIGFGRVGYRLAPHWRIEVEGGYRPGHISSIKGDSSRALANAVCSGTYGGVPAGGIPAGACGTPGGSVKTFTGMFNVLYDFMPDSAFSPFIGAGVGANKVLVRANGQFNGPGGVGPVLAPAETYRIRDSDTVLAYQAIAGLTYAYDDHWNLDLTYRYLGGDDVTFAGRASGTNQPGDFSGEYKDQSVTIGVRYAFNSPAPPPPPPAPAPPPPAPASAAPPAASAAGPPASAASGL